MHPYHISLHQETILFREWIFDRQEKSIQDDVFLSKIIFSEATFNNIGAVNRHNVNYWSPINSRWMQVSTPLHVWCDILGDSNWTTFFWHNS